jgi:hypothetical protein
VVVNGLCKSTTFIAIGISCFTFLIPAGVVAPRAATPLGPATWGNPNQP